MAQAKPLIACSKHVGYDLAAFFKRNSRTLRSELDKVLKALLAPETPPS